MGDVVKGVKTMMDKINFSTAVIGFIAIATASWALSTEIHNYRLRNITTRIKTHEDYIMSSIEDRNKIWRSIDRLTIISSNTIEMLRAHIVGE